MILITLIIYINKIFYSMHHNLSFIFICPSSVKLNTNEIPKNLPKILFKHSYTMLHQKKKAKSYKNFSIIYLYNINFFIHNDFI